MRRSSMLLLIQLLLVTSTFAVDGDWGYKGRNGPNSWGGECKKKEQSPIDLPREGGTKINYDPFIFTNYDRTPERCSITNNGHTVKVSFENKQLKGNEPEVRGGGLPANYGFAQYHMHWGASDNVGSEHTISQTSYPMELHLVHYNKKYGDNIGSAIAKGLKYKARDSLAVLGIMFQLQTRANKNLDPMIEVLEEIAAEDSKSYTKLFQLHDLLPEDTARFYRYNGSLTTPGCNEIVVWTVFKDPISISKGQLERFRALAKNHTGMIDNFRPTLPLNGRTVYDVTATAGVEVVHLSFGLALLTIALSKFFLA